MQYKFFLVTTLLALCLFISPSLALANDVSLEREERNDYLCDTLKEDCSQQKDVKIVTIGN